MPSSKNDGRLKKLVDRQRSLGRREKLPNKRLVRRRNRGEGNTKAQQAAQRAAEWAAQAAREEAERIRREAEAAAHAAWLARQQAEARAREERERQEKIRRELEAERARARIAEEAAKKAAIAAQEEENRRQKAREEEMQRARERQAAAEEEARKAAEQARKAKEAQKEVERQLKEGIQPVVMPTADELRAAKKTVQYKDGVFHFAIAGVAGSGKSSLVNALCGMNNQDPNAAATGVVETTLEVARYTNPNHCRPIRVYFNSQGLYVFDCIIVLFNNRFTMTDQAILANCRRFKIPTFIVRSKADQHIRNLMGEMGYDSDDEAEAKEGMYKAAREQFISETRRSVKENLLEAKLPDQRVYTVSHRALLGIVRDKTPKKTIDELDLLRDLYDEAHRSRKHGFGVSNVSAQSL
ncbi:hypothetical protein J3R82DRAFT_4788 [Butyriboletus roseoflavus]|nr:hypothetical protein J3R82DRAFT_4788 [Butyriboletus roseoflavus]